jgi:hypothetical protein
MMTGVVFAVTPNADTTQQPRIATKIPVLIVKQYSFATTVRIVSFAATVTVAVVVPAMTT